MKVLLTHGYFLEEDEKEKLILKPYPPLGILSISAYLEANGVANSVFDSTFSSFEKLCSHLENERPDVIGIYTNLMTRTNVLRIMAWIRNHHALSKTFIVLGGPEIRNSMQQFLDHGADALVPGEGEETMLDLVRQLAAGDKVRGEVLGQVKGIAYCDKDGKMVQSARPLLKEIDLLPSPARHQINLNLYLDTWKKKHGLSAINVSTMRGCPYTCKWCSRAVYGQTYRRRSPACVADELESLQQTYTFDTIWFVDDVFTINPKWLADFAKVLAERKLMIRYECITRADRLDDTTLVLLKSSGCFRVWIGAESGSQRILDAMDRRVEVQQVRSTIRQAKKAGMEAGTFIMLGYPGETEEDIEETIRHLVESDPDLYTITVAYPIRGTPLFTEVESGITTNLPWSQSTDRDLDFKRTYPRKYYDFALRRLYNEVAFHKKTAGMGRYRFKLKSLAAKSGMRLVRMFS